MPLASSHGSRPGRVPGWGSVFLAAVLGLVVGDWIKPAREQFGARLAVGLIDTYRATLSPAFERTGLIRCRFHPTCSAYGREAILRYGWPKGGALAATRILRCNPFAKGGEDPVP
jgi:putative membrane protein insertion efficiency factor